MLCSAKNIIYEEIGDHLVCKVRLTSEILYHSIIPVPPYYVFSRKFIIQQKSNSHATLDKITFTKNKTNNLFMTAYAAFQTSTEWSLKNEKKKCSEKANHVIITKRQTKKLPTFQR